MKKLISFCFLLLTGFTLSYAQKVTFYANISGSKGSPEVGWMGHVWCGFSSTNAGGETMYGFYPEGLIPENARPSDISYSWKVSGESFSRVVVVINEYQQKGYLLGVRDCRNFARDVAMAAGLSVPSAGIKSPAEWLADLVDLN